MKKTNIVLFQCQFCLASSADQTWVENELPKNVKLVKVQCSGRINPLFIMNAFQRGADGVLVSGCMPEKCHYITSNLGARRQLDEFKDFLVFLGMDAERIQFAWMNISERGVIQNVVADFSARIEEMGKNTRFNTVKGEILGVRNG